MRLLRWIFKTLLFLLFLVAVLLTAVTFLKIPIDLTRFKEPVEVLASKALERPVRIEDSVVISTSMSPVFTMEGLRIQNPDTFENQDFLYMKSAVFQLELLPLLKKKVHVAEFSVNGLDITLEENRAGEVNWIFDSGDEDQTGDNKGAQEPAAEKGQKPKVELASDTIVVKKLDFRNIGLIYYNPTQPEPAKFKLAYCTGAMLPGEPLALDIAGELLGFPYDVDISIASLAEFITDNRSWLDITAAIAETEFKFGGNVNLETAGNSIRLETSVSGKNLASLNDLVRVDLPPFAEYEVSTSLHAEQGLFKMEKLLVKTGDSSLEGNAFVQRTETGSEFELVLTSPSVQVNDFIFDDWSPTVKETGEEVVEEEVEEGGEEVATEEEGAKEKNRKLVDPELLAKHNGKLSITSDQVLSGADLLGSGVLEVTLADGRIALDPLLFNLPGGKIEMKASIKPGTEKSDATLKVNIENFDIGIAVRRSKPESDMGGLVNLDVDLSSSAGTLPELLANGNGYFDYSGKLENLGAGIIDLWAVNLVAAIVSSSDENQSEINCAIGRWSVQDGMLRPDVFVIDTSKIRICGAGRVDFGTSSLSLKVGPTSKRPEFFSLSTPMRVSGSFTDLNIGLGGGGVIGTTVKFITSPVHVPLRRVFTEQIPEDGSDICSMEIGPVERADIVVQGCN